MITLFSKTFNAAGQTIGRRGQVATAAMSKFESRAGALSYFQQKPLAGQGESTFNFILGLDGISLFFVILTTFLIFVCLLVGWSSIVIYIK